MQDAYVRILFAGGEQTHYSQVAELLDTIRPGAYQLVWCAYLDKALAELKAGRYDLAMIDCLHQPNHALQLFQQLQQLDCLVPLIALVGAAESSLDDGLEGALEGEYMLGLGAADHLCIDNLQPNTLERSIRYLRDRNAIGQYSQHQFYDPLTGIPNRLLFRQSLQQALVRARTQQISLGLLVINLDGFNKINDSFGHDAGDELVCTIARRLIRCVRKSDGVARLGGDEFALILDDCHGSDDVALVARKVVDILSAPVTIDDNPVMISVSVGAAMFPETGDSVDGLLKRAMMAMREAKTHRGSHVHFYSEATHIDALHRINLENDLRRALRANEFELCYQPRVDLLSGETVGMESLIRWHHPTRGMVSPAEFIPVAEECGLIIPIGYWVIQQACSDMKMFDISGKQKLDVAVNLSFKQLQDEMFVDTVTRIIQQSGVDATRLEFELTETAIMSNFKQTYAGMKALNQLGITFSLDDFGTGFSSFAHIQQLPISALKIDRSFIQRVIENKDDAVIVKAVINLAHSLRLRVVAEGVETLEQVQFLWHNHCDQVQGFYFSPALQSTDFCQLVEQRTTVVA